MEDTYYLVSDGRVLLNWADTDRGDNYYIYEEALEDEQLLTEYILTGKTFQGETYALAFSRGYTLRCDFLDGITEARSGAWELSGDTITIIWDDGETDEATLNLDGEKTVRLSSTGETLEDPFGF